MQICYINPPIEYYSPVSGGAIATILMQSAKQLVKRGHYVTVLTPDKGDAVYPIGNVVPVASPDRTEIHPLRRKLAVLKYMVSGWDYAYFEFYLRSVVKTLRTLSPAPDAVIVFNDLVTPRYVKVALPNTRTIVWLQNEANTRMKRVETWEPSIDHFLTCSQYIKDTTVKKYGISPNKITVVHSGVDLEAFYPADDFPTPHDPIKALYIGRIDPNKGPDIAVEAVRRLRLEGVHVDLTVAGGIWYYLHGNEHEDTYLRDLTVACKTIGAACSGHIPRPEVPALVRDHDIAFVLSRSNEPFGLVTLEAMASGCAVIASNRGGLPESCDTGATLLDPDDINDVVRALRNLAQNPEQLEAWKRKAVERASRASWDAVGDIFTAAVERVHAT